MSLTLSEKYKPRLQKELFYQNIVQDIKKWTKTNLIESSDNYKKILCLIGPIGCGKTTIINTLFSNYQLIKLDSDSLRLNERISDILENLVDYKTKTIADIGKWDNKNYKQKNNILFLDNIELCDKSISQFINLLYNHYNVNIPLITITNNPKNSESFENYQNITTFIHFSKVDDTDINNLLIKIVSSEIEFKPIKVSKPIQNKIIEKSENDIRQLFYILEQLRISLKQNIDFDIENSLEEMETKFRDIDLSQKIYKLLMVKDMKLEDKYNIGTSEPQLISYSIYQNYPIFLNEYSNDITDIDTAADIMESISSSNIINSSIYDQQNWELYDDYTFSSCVIPSMILNNCILKEINENQFTEQLTTFKDVSYNFSNSLTDVREIIKNNNFSTHLQSIIDKKSSNNENSENSNNYNHINLLEKDIVYIYNIIRNMTYCIEQINKYFDDKKRGKNTTKKEKFKICNLIDNIEITDPLDITNVKIILDYISEFIYVYKIFEIDIQDILINKKSYNIKENRQKDINKIDIRIFKRLLNIFTFDNSNKLLKSHTEIAIQYQLFTKLINDININKCNELHNNNMEKLIVDLESVWNLN